MATGVLSHYLAGSRAVCVEGREEPRFLGELLSELPDGAEVMTCAAPGGPWRDARTGVAQSGGYAAALAWLSAAPGRVLVVYDWHVLVNNPGQWRGLIDALPMIGEPKNAKEGDLGGLVVFVGPVWDIQRVNVLYGNIPMVKYGLPDEAAIRTILNNLHPLNGDADACVDAMRGLSGIMIEQAAAEVLQRTGGHYDVDMLLDSKRQELARAGLEVWPPHAEIGGLSGLRDVVETELIPSLHDSQLAIRRILCAGMPGMGKSYFARWLGHRLKRLVCNWSPGRSKGKYVGDTEGAVANIFATLDALSPSILVIDEVDCALSRESGDPTAGPVMQMFLSWLQESKSDTIVIATLNRLDKLDAALESRFALRFFFDLGTQAERESVAAIHYERLGCLAPHTFAETTALHTEGFSSREIAEQVCRSVARKSNRKPTDDIIREVCASVTPASKTQAEQLKAMRQAARTLRRANDPESVVTQTAAVRRIQKGGGV